MKNLPEYTPNDKVWQHIEAKLNDEVLKETLSKMPLYEPNEELWGEISAELKPNKTRYLKWVAAASIVLICSIYFLKKDNKVQFSKQIIKQEQLIKTVAKSNSSYEEIKKVCETEKVVCAKPEFRVLESELEELNSASLALQEAIGKYNTEPALLSQLTDIETQKAEVIKKMTAQI